MQFKQLSTVLLAVVLPAAVLATHEIGDPCTKDSYHNTYGCSTDGCAIVKCIEETDGNGAYYWAAQSSCHGLGMCNNGVCNGDVDESNSCSA